MVKRREKEFYLQSSSTSLSHLLIEGKLWGCKIISTQTLSFIVSKLLPKIIVFSFALQLISLLLFFGTLVSVQHHYPKNRKHDLLRRVEIFQSPFEPTSTKFLLCRFVFLNLWFCLNAFSSSNVSPIKSIFPSDRPTTYLIYSKLLSNK